MSCNSSIEVFSTCPPSTGVAQDRYVERLVEIARWSEEAGCKGILVCSDNSVLDPWALTHIILQHTKTLCPLVAIQPVYMHPYWVAKQISTLAYLYGRRLYLNIAAGGFKNDLEALNDTTPHDKQYTRLIEYTTIIMGLLASSAPLTFDGEFHRVSKLKLMPPLPDALLPGVFISGSSEAGVAAARTLAATAIKYLKPAGEEDSPIGDLHLGIRVGIIARAHPEEAWDVARARFPDDRAGHRTEQLVEKKVSDTYWLAPFLDYKAMCPYLVGSYRQVAQRLARYFGAGYGTVILDIPPNPDELSHTFTAFEAAMQPGAMGA